MTSWDHILIGEQFKKVTGDGVFRKERKEQMGLAFFIWTMKVLSDLEIGNHLSCEVFFCMFFFFFARYTCTN
jgi:hypothetical protein